MNEIRKINTAEGDRWVYRPIMWVLGLLPLALIAFWGLSLSSQKPIELNAGLLSLASAAVGALVSFLTTGATRNPGQAESKLVDRIETAVGTLESGGATAISNAESPRSATAATAS